MKMKEEKKKWYYINENNEEENKVVWKVMKIMKRRKWKCNERK